MTASAVLALFLCLAWAAGFLAARWGYRIKIAELEQHLDDLESQLGSLREGNWIVAEAHRREIEALSSDDVSWTHSLLLNPPEADPPAGEAPEPRPEE